MGCFEGCREIFTGDLSRRRLCDLPGGVGEMGPADWDVDLGAFRSILRVRALGIKPSGHRLAVGRRVGPRPDLEAEEPIGRKGR